MANATRRALLAAGFVLGSGMAAQAQQMRRLRGSITALTPDLLTVRTDAGATEQVKLDATASVAVSRQLSLADVKQGDFIGVGGRPQPDGSQLAVQLMVFPAAMRGVGEGFRPWAPIPDGTMTNANVDAVVSSTDGPKLTLSYKGGSKTIVTDAATRVLTFAPASPAALAVGKFVSVYSTATATRITVADRAQDLPM